MLWTGSAKAWALGPVMPTSRLIPVARRGDGSAEQWQHGAACSLKTCPFVSIMKAGNCDQFALIEADQCCIDHVFHWHDDQRGLLLPKQDSDLPAVRRCPLGKHCSDA